ncbi:hypothetical protein G3578_14240 [Brevibacillus sp. SYP-B805]|uniref:hypothetical protein n=1 Tax=Brevibacillus sp. SYP-B805 TaxID=1578199 RepID=UPI0013EDC76B|nr:hypothetical protein [Brevibacillus sp. SYP-B805]NGQ96321.1 hypothetical protein [Brevibacillus sp. SYP-B805]
MWKWLLALVLIVQCLIAIPAAADEPFDLSIHLPLGGVIKNNQWTRVEVSITNNGGERFSGEMEFGDEPHSGLNRAIYRQAITLDAGETKNVPIDLPAEMLMQGPTEVRLIKGEQVMATEEFPPITPKGERVVGVIADEPSAFHFLAIGSDQRLDNWIPFTVQHFEPDALPDQSWILKNLDMIAIGPLTSGKLKENQLAALKEYVRRGGVLILSARPGDDELVQQFRDLLPVAGGQGGMLTNLGELERWTGSTPLPLSSIPVYNRQFLLITAKQIDGGVYLFANYDVTAEPMASWQYNRQLWKKVLTQSKAVERMAEKDERSPLDVSLVSLSKLIPGVQVPSVGWIILIWLVYLLVLAPGLYLALKRWERREWAWGIIPVTAILLSVTVYLFGRTTVAEEDASYRVSMLRILDKDLTEVQTAASFLTVSGGSYSVRAENGFLAVPLAYNQVNMADDDTMMGTDGQGSKTIQFRNVPYLSIKQAVASGILRDIGSFDAVLQTNGDRLQGVIVNRTRLPMEEVYLNLGLQRIALGSLQPGEKKQVDAKIEEYVFPQQSDQDSPYERALNREQQIARQKEWLMNGESNQLRLIGVSSQPLHTLELLQQGQKHDWNVVVQNISLMPDASGHIVYPYGTLPVQKIDEKGIVDYRHPNIWNLGRGEVTFALSVDQSGLDVTKVEIPLDQSPYRPFRKEIYHAKTGKWKQLGREERVILGKELGEYLNREGQILVRFTNPTDQRFSLPQPYLRLEGVEKSK